MRRLMMTAALGLASWGWSEPACAQTSADAASTSGVSAGAASGRFDAPAVDRPPANGSSSSADSFMRRYRPTALSFEAGIFGGTYVVSDKHNQQDLSMTIASGHEKLGPGGELGLRLAFFPLAFLGGELEGGLILNDTERTDDSTKTWIVRGHGILQLPLGRLVPFLVGGGGLTSLRAAGSLGNDKDPVAYFGGGLKFACTPYLSLRVDLRDNIAQKNKLISSVKNGDSVQNFEFLGGLSLTLGRTPWSPEIPDHDADDDGVDDDRDRCPSVAGLAPEGCPPPPDGDGDGVADPSDPCPSEREDGHPPAPMDGCPNKDLDADNILLPDDLCPSEAGLAPDGCPARDADGDGLLDANDKCPTQAETTNHFEDHDGCPDVLPPEIQKFTGVIKGILFPTGKATIRPASLPLLDDAATVLLQYPALRLRVSGHTDSTGDHDRNMRLSEDRAAAIKTYLGSKGIDTSRVETRGAGPDEPLAENSTAAGKAQNRRIEFELLPQSQ